MSDIAHSETDFRDLQVLLDGFRRGLTSSELRQLHRGTLRCAPACLAPPVSRLHSVCVQSYCPTRPSKLLRATLSWGAAYTTVCPSTRKIIRGNAQKPICLARRRPAHAAATHELLAPLLPGGGGVPRRSSCHLSHNIFIHVQLMVATLSG